MQGLDLVDPFDDLKEWSADINEFMDGICRPLPSDLVNQFEQWSDDIGARVELGLPIPDSYPFGFYNSATTYWEAMNPELLSDLEKDLNSLHLFGKDKATEP